MVLKQFSSNYGKNKYKITILFLFENPKNNNIIFSIRISILLIQRKEQAIMKYLEAT